MHGFYDKYVNGLYEYFVNGVYWLSINVRPCDVIGLQEFSTTSMKGLSINVFSRNLRDSVGVTSESGITGMNELGMEMSLNGMNVLNGLVT